jgi:hypothetical protein
MNTAGHKTKKARKTQEISGMSDNGRNYDISTMVRDSLKMLDASPEDQEYCSDVTRTYLVNGVFSVKEKLVYDIVLAYADAGIGAMKAGADWNVDVCPSTDGRSLSSSGSDDTLCGGDKPQERTQLLNEDNTAAE